MEHRGDGGGSRWAQVSAQLGLEEGGSLGSGFVLLDFWEAGVFSRHDIKQARDSEASSKSFPLFITGHL